VGKIVSSEDYFHMKDIWLPGFEFAHACFSPVFSGEVRAAWEGGHQSCVPPLLYFPASDQG
jgi:hypothetical protein